MKEFKILISPDGKKFVSLYHDDLGLQKIGKLNIQRATEVFWYNGHWKVKILATDEVLPELFENRADAIQHEINYLQEHMAELCPYINDELKRCSQ